MMSDTHTAQAGEVTQIPSDLWRGWVFGETGSLWEKPEKSKHHFVNHTYPLPFASLGSSARLRSC